MTPLPGVRVFTVSELTEEIKQTLEENYPALWIGGEVTALKKATSGHWYFTLQDKQAVLPAVMWRGSNLRIRFDLKDGMEVLCRGRLTVYAPQGKYQFTVEEIHPKGIGAQELALQQLRKRLFEKGYFDPKRKKPLPRFPSRIGVITSPTGAAIRDILAILQRRWPMTEVLVIPVRVQGATAAAEIRQALDAANRWKGLDVLVLARGGGGTEDLGAFNDEGIADAIYRSRLPVVSAVGHEIDVTIADLVADQRAATPSEAAERLVPDVLEVRKMLTEQAGRLRELLLGRLTWAQQTLRTLAERRCFRRPTERLREQEQRLDQIGDRLRRGMQGRLDRHDRALRAMAAQLDALSPLNVLGRGYSLTRRTDDSRVVRGVVDVRPGDVVTTTVQNGQFTSRVEEIVPTP